VQSSALSASSFLAGGRGLDGFAVEALSAAQEKAQSPCNQSPHGFLSRSHPGLCQALGLGPFFTPCRTVRFNAVESMLFS
jgi:hypothetical protein